jgi:hypothetical protein
VSLVNNKEASSSSVAFHNAGTFYWAAFYSGDSNNKSAVSGCGTEKLTVVSVTAQITPTNTTCQAFSGGTSETLNEVTYQTKGKSTKIFNAQPGVFFYFVKVKAEASSFTVDVPQTILGGTGPLFEISSTSAFTSNCTAFKSIKVSGSAADDIIEFSNATAGQAYFVAIKYSPKSIVGLPTPSPENIVYKFVTKLNGGEVVGTARTLKLVKTG